MPQQLVDKHVVLTASRENHPGGGGPSSRRHGRFPGRMGSGMGMGMGMGMGSMGGMGGMGFMSGMGMGMGMYGMNDSYH